MFLYSRDEFKRIQNILDNDVFLNDESFINILKSITRIDKDFDILKYYLENLNKNEKVNFYSILLPFIFKAVILGYNKEFNTMQSNDGINELKFTKLQVLTILSNMFLCTIDQPIFEKEEIYNNINFIEIFNSQPEYHGYYSLDGEEKLNITNQNDIKKIKIEKIKFILSYFNTIQNLQRIDRLDYRIVKFVKITNTELPKLNKQKLTDIDISNKKFEECDSMYSIFSSGYIGGAVLSNGCHKEEIISLIHPELLVACLFLDKINKYEAIQVYGLNRYSSYTGYDIALQYKKINFSNLHLHNVTYINSYNADRRFEILKTYNAFNVQDIISISIDKCNYIKFLIQWLAASLNNKKIIYCYRDSQITNIVEEFRNKSIMDLYLYIMKYN